MPAGLGYPHRVSSVTVAWHLDDRFRETAAFWNDSAVTEREVHLTCERCPLDACAERVVDATLARRAEAREAKEAALAALGALP